MKSINEFPAEKRIEKTEAEWKKELTPEQFKILRNPEMILPPNYITYLLKEINQNNPLDIRAVRDLEMGLRNLKMAISSLPDEVTFENKELDIALNRLERAVVFLRENYRRNRNRGLFNE
jgi:hypothetical protein